MVSLTQKDFLEFIVKYRDSGFSNIVFNDFLDELYLKVKENRVEKGLFLQEPDFEGYDEVKRSWMVAHIHYLSRS